MAFAIIAAWIIGLSIAGSASAWAHNADEILQQVYVTPSAQGLDVSVEITAGGQVAVGLLSGIDTNADGTISPSEAAAHAETIRAALSMTLDSQASSLQLAKATYPDVSVLAVGGGTIILDFNATAPKASGPQTLRLTSTYAPSTSTGPLLTKVQVNLTPDTEVPIVVESISHPDDGRTLVASYTLLAVAPTGATTANNATATTTTAAASGWVPPAVAAAVAALGAAGLIIRRRRRQRSAAPTISPLTPVHN